MCDSFAPSSLLYYKEGDAHKRVLYSNGMYCMIRIYCFCALGLLARRGFSLHQSTPRVFSPTQPPPKNVIRGIVAAGSLVRGGWGVFGGWCGCSFPLGVPAELSVPPATSSVGFSMGRGRRKSQPAAPRVDRFPATSRKKKG